VLPDCDLMAALFWVLEGLRSIGHSQGSYTGFAGDINRYGFGAGSEGRCGIDLHLFPQAMGVVQTLTGAIRR
jgi:hypothetical protein